MLLLLLVLGAGAVLAIHHKTGRPAFLGRLAAPQRRPGGVLAALGGALAGVKAAGRRPASHSAAASADFKPPAASPWETPIQVEPGDGLGTSPAGGAPAAPPEQPAIRTQPIGNGGGTRNGSTPAWANDPGPAGELEARPLEGSASATPIEPFGRTTSAPPKPKDPWRIPISSPDVPASGPQRPPSKRAESALER